MNPYPHKDICGRCLREDNKRACAEIDPVTNLLKYCPKTKAIYRSVDIPVPRCCTNKAKLRKYAHVKRPVKHSVEICRRCCDERDGNNDKNAFKDWLEKQACVPCWLVARMKATSICNDVHPDCPYLLEHFLATQKEDDCV
jgi:hypothetical protein